jgi:hypothetical protein
VAETVLGLAKRALAGMIENSAGSFYLEGEEWELVVRDGGIFAVRTVEDDEGGAPSVEIALSAGRVSRE